MLKFTSVLAAAGFAMLPLASQAATPTLGDVLKASGITANGYVDFGSTWNNRGTDGYAGVGGLQGAKDVSFRLNQVDLAVTTALSEGFNGTLEVLAGQDAQAITADGTGDIKFKQAYASYTNGGLTVMGGRYITLAGSEVINSSQNINATRGLLFSFLQPSTHTGVRASYAFGKVVTLTGGYANSALAVGVPFVGTGGAAALTVDNNPQKTLEAQVAVTPFDGFNNALTYYRGVEQGGATTPRSAPALLDLVSSIQVTKALSFGLNYDWYNAQNVFAGTGGVANTTSSQIHGVALYSNFQICEALRLAGRAEYVEGSSTLYTGAGTPTGTDSRFDGFEYTLTTGYAVAKNFDVITDVRFDKLIGTGGNTGAGTNVFGQGAPNFTPANGDTTKGNALTSVTVKAIYKF